MQTVINASDSADLLAVVPALAGYHPTDSIVFVLFEGTRSLGLMRLDLPDDDCEVSSTAATMIGLACKVRSADGFAMVVYTPRALSDRGDPSFRELVEAVLDRAHACGMTVRDALCHASDGWTSYLVPGAARPLDEITARTCDAFVRAPRSDRSQAAGTDLPEFDLAARERVGRALRALERCLDSLTDAEPSPVPDDIDTRTFAAACSLDDPPEMFEEALSWRLDAPDALAMSSLVWALARPMLRDVALAQWCRGRAAGYETLAAQFDWREGAEMPERVAQHLWGAGAAPDAARLRTALALTRTAAALAPRESRAGALSAAAWLSWALGRSTHAVSYADSALAIDSAHGLAQIVRTMAMRAHLPEWVFSRSVSA